MLLIVVFLRGGRGKSLTVRQYVDRAESVEVCRFRYLAFFLAHGRPEKLVALRQALSPGLAALMKADWDPVG
ncbi:MAG: hypothetical protein GY856_29260, partial [bacterium]|nr:hypothetical protein [bacterium]